MKVILVPFLVALIFGSAFPYSYFLESVNPLSNSLSSDKDREILDELKDFGKLYPWEDFAGLARLHLKDLRATINYIKSGQFENTVQMILSSPLGKILLALVFPEVNKSEGELVKQITQIIKEEFPVPQEQVCQLKAEEEIELFGLEPLLNQMLALLPIAELQELFDMKMEYSEVFRNFVDQYARDDVILVWLNLLKSADVQPQFEELERHGINLRQFGTVFLTLIGYC